MATRRRPPEELFNPAVRWILTTILLLSIIVPLCYMIVLSVTPNVEAAAGVLFPHHLALSNYAKMWAGTGLARGLVNSVIICGASSIIAVLLGLVGGYVSARAKFIGRGAFLTGLLAFQSVPTVMILLPMVIVMAGLQNVLNVAVVGTHWAMVVAYLTFALPLVTWFVAAYMDSVPREIDDAARLDGAGSIRVLFRIVLPLIVPALAVAAVLSFLVGWGDLLIATIISGPDTHTVAVTLNNFLATQEGQTLPQYGTLMAASLVSALPIIVLYLGLQRFIVAGLTGAAVK